MLSSEPNREGKMAGCGPMTVKCLLLYWTTTPTQYTRLLPDAHRVLHARTPNFPTEKGQKNFVQSKILNYCSRWLKSEILDSLSKNRYLQSSNIRRVSQLWTWCVSGGRQENINRLLMFGLISYFNSLCSKMKWRGLIHIWTCTAQFVPERRTGSIWCSAQWNTSHRHTLP